MNARRGLKKIGMRTYQITGPDGVVEIERDHARRWLVRGPGYPRPFFNMDALRLRDARDQAELWAGIK